MFPEPTLFRRRAFTLVELLVVCALIVFVMATTGAVIAAGFRVWERLRTHGDMAQQVMVGLAQIRKDIRSARRFSQLPFEGKYDRFSVAGRMPHEEPDFTDLAAITYRLDNATGDLCRSVVPLRDPRAARKRGCSTVLSGVKRLRFSYLGQEPDSTNIGWQSHWESPQPPLAVRLEIQLRDLEESKDIPRSFVIGIPIAQTKLWQAPE